MTMNFEDVTKCALAYINTADHITDLERRGEVVLGALRMAQKKTRQLTWNKAGLLNYFDNHELYRFYESQETGDAFGSLSAFLADNQFELFDVKPTQGLKLAQVWDFYINDQPINKRGTQAWLKGFAGLGIQGGERWELLYGANITRLYASRPVLVAGANVEEWLNLCQTEECRQIDFDILLKQAKVDLELRDELPDTGDLLFMQGQITLGNLEAYVNRLKSKWRGLSPETPIFVKVVELRRETVEEKHHAMS